MVWKVCSRSQGQPLPGVRSAAMISISRAMSREGFTGAGGSGLWMAADGAGDATVAKPARRRDRASI